MSNLTVFGDWADRYDALVAYDERALDGWVESTGYSTGSMVLASTALSFVKFAQSFTDIGRLGNGLFIDGGLKGAASDAMRALNLVGSASAVLGRAGQLFRVMQASESGVCTFAAQANALRLTGTRFLITAEELIRKVGGDVEHVTRLGAGGEEYSKLLAFLERARIPHQLLLKGATGAERSLKALENTIRSSPAGVVTFGIKATGRLSKLGEIVSRDHLIHRLYATFSLTKGLRIFDPLGPTFSSLEELIASFRDLQLTRSPIILVKNSVMLQGAHLAQRVTELSTAVSHLAFHVLPVVRVPAADPQTAAQFIALRDGIPSPSKTSPPTGKINSNDAYTVTSGDTLSAIAKSYYGDANKWPLIYLVNKDTVGRSPDLLKPGQTLKLPVLQNAQAFPALVPVSPLR